MACAAVRTGQSFLSDMLAHVDCQAQSIGAYGYGALSDPGSSVSLALTGLLTIFVAIFGMRLLLGERMGARDLVGTVLKLGIVLTLAGSWPAWRTIGYDLVLYAPAEIASSIGLASGLPGSDGELTNRLQAVDDGIVILTIYGSGRMTGGRNRSDSIGDSFRGIALADQEALGWGRVAFLGGVIGPSAAVRLGAGFLLALAPLMAALLLFAGTRDLFYGWARGLAACMVGAIALPLVYGVQLAVMEPWVADAVAQRSAQVLTPSVPTELIVIGLAFAVVAVASLLLVARVAFFGGFPLARLEWLPDMVRAMAAPPPGAAPLSTSTLLVAPPSRAYAIAQAVSHSMWREDNRGVADGATRRGPDTVQNTTRNGDGPVLIGDSYRVGAARRTRRTSGAGERRDVRS